MTEEQATKLIELVQYLIDYIMGQKKGVTPEAVKLARDNPELVDYVANIDRYLGEGLSESEAVTKATADKPKAQAGPT